LDFWLIGPETGNRCARAVLSTTVVSVALPTIGRDLRASAAGLEWTVDAYVLVYASLLLAGGVAGDRCGRKGTFLLGVAPFGLGSLAAGLAPSAGLLLAGGVLQGTGPALLIPGSLAIIRAVFTDDRQRSAAVGLWSTGSGVAMALGPALGGVIVGAMGWRWVFLFNVPLTAALVMLGVRVIPRMPRTPARGPFDWAGAVASASGVGLSPAAAGVAVCAIGVAYALAAAWSGRLVGRISERWPLLTGLVISGLAMLALRRLGPGTGLSAIWWIFALLGAGVGLCGTPMTTLALSAVDASRAGMDSAVLNSLRQIGQVSGVALIVTAAVVFPALRRP